MLGLTLLGASQAVAEVGLTANVTLTDSAVHAAGLVIAQQPPAGSVVRRGCQVLLVVARAARRP